MKLKEILKYPLVYVFFIIILTLTVLDLTAPFREYSELENMKLASKPKFTVWSYLSSEFSRSYEKYVNEQFVWRDTWIDIKSLSELSLFKLENNNIIYGKDGFLLDKEITLDSERIDKNILVISDFLSSLPDEQFSKLLVLVPNSYELLSDKLPAPVALADQRAVIDYIYSRMNGVCDTLDVYTPLSGMKDEYIYYRTDHHWTTLGAYTAYEAITGHFGTALIGKESFTKHETPDFLGTYFSKAKNVNVKSDTITWYDIPGSSMSVDGNILPIMNEQKLGERDKYAAFIYGNNGHSVVTNENAPEEGLLVVIKDSYANSLIPFLSATYKTIHVIDIRFFNDRMSEFMKTIDSASVMILYNLSTFSKENISMLRS